MRKTIIFLITLSMLLFIFINSAFSATLLKGGPVCLTEESLQEFIIDAINKDKAHMMHMMVDGKCYMNVMEDMHAVVIKSKLTRVKVRILWGKKYVTGWTPVEYIRD